MVRLATEKEDRAVSIADRRCVEGVEPELFHPEGEHRDDHLLDRAGRPVAMERHRMAVVGDVLRGVLL